MDDPLSEVAGFMYMSFVSFVAAGFSELQAIQLCARIYVEMGNYPQQFKQAED